MRIAIKYGGFIAVGVAIWVLADHLVLHISRPESKANLLTPLVFNLLQFSLLFAGIRAKRLASGGKLTLGQGIMSGLAISLAYFVLASAFFLVAYLVAGSKLLENESPVSGVDQPARYLLLSRFAGLFFGAVVLGLLYSTVISFALRTDTERGQSGKSGLPAKKSKHARPHGSARSSQRRPAGRR
jgi:hypothetical protein